MMGFVRRLLGHDNPHRMAKDVALVSARKSALNQIGGVLKAEANFRELVSLGYFDSMVFSGAISETLSEMDRQQGADDEDRTP